jgi:feruloyl esterase
MDLVGNAVTRQCDALDGITDGLIQNPAACNFRAERDLPLCDGSNVGQCFTKVQTQTVISLLSAATDEAAQVVQPGYSVSEPSAAFVPLKLPANLDNPVLWDREDAVSGYWGLADSMIGVLAHRNDPAFRLRAIFSYATGDAPAPLLLYHNLSDGILSPYMSINFYKRLAARHGGYANVQRSARLFTLPGTAHCGMGGVGPTNFDAIGAMEAWVESGKAPNALLARQLDPAFNNVIRGQVDWSKPALRTMPLCKSPKWRATKELAK